MRINEKAQQIEKRDFLCIIKIFCWVDRPKESDQKLKFLKELILNYD